MYTFRTVEIRPNTSADDHRAITEMLKELELQGWVLADWRSASVGDTCAFTVLVTMRFERPENKPGVYHRYVSYEGLKSLLVEWRDAQSASLATEDSPRLAGAVEAFDLVLESIESMTKWA